MINATLLGLLIIMERELKDVYSRRRLTETQCSFPLPVTVMVPRCTARVHTDTIGLPPGTRRATPGACTSVPGVSTLAASAGTMGSLFAGFASENSFLHIDSRGNQGDVSDGIPLFDD